MENLINNDLEQSLSDDDIESDSEADNEFEGDKKSKKLENVLFSNTFRRVQIWNKMIMNLMNNLLMNLKIKTVF